MKLEKLREQLSVQGVDAFLITSPSNRFYMTGFTGTSGVAFVTADQALFITDFRYTEQAAAQAQGYEIVQHKGPIPEEVATQAEALGVKKIGFEQDYVTYSEYEAYERAFSKGELVGVKGALEQLRLMKDEKELKIVKDACDIADAAFKHILEYIQPGRTELDVSNELEFFMRKAGATSSSFDIIVASGARSALPHGVATDKVIQTGELVTMDFGARYKGYASDITRTIGVGEVSEELRQVYDIVLESQLRAMEGIQPGMTGKEADSLARNLIAEKGYGEYFGHSLGHGLGVDVHEAPSLSAKSDMLLEEGMIVTVEPGIYLPGKGGVRIEDDTLVTKDGNETLTHSTKEWITL